MVCSSAAPRLTRTVVPAIRSYRNASRFPLVSPGTRFVACEMNSTRRPSWDSLGFSLAPLASAPPMPTLTRSVTPLARSNTNTSAVPFVSPVTRFEALDRYAMVEPSADTNATFEAALPGAPPGVREIRTAGDSPSLARSKMS